MQTADGSRPEEPDVKKDLPDVSALSDRELAEFLDREEATRTFTAKDEACSNEVRRRCEAGKSGREFIADALKN